MENMMMQSEAINQLAAALAKAQGQIQGAIKGKINPAFKSKYADLASVWDACREQLSSNGLAIMQTFDTTADGVFLTTTLVHSSGQWMKSVFPVRPVKNDPQGLGSATTYARRYALAAMVGVAPDDDDDGNAASAKPPARKSDAVPTPMRDIPPPLELYNAVGEVETVHSSIEEYLVDLGNRVKQASWWFDQNETVVDYLERDFGTVVLPKWGRSVSKVCEQLRRMAGEKPAAGAATEKVNA